MPIRSTVRHNLLRQMKRILDIYDYFSRHKKILWLTLAGTVIVILGLILHLKYSEDISDFLPLDASEQEAFSIYQNISGADRLFVIFNNPDDPDMVTGAMSYFGDLLSERDTLGWCSDLTVRFDMGRITEVADFVYSNIPYFLTEEDYARMDSLMAVPGYMDRRLQENKRLLMFPSGGMAVSGMTRDPFGFFTPVLGRLQTEIPQLGMEMYDGYIFTPDMSRAIAMLTSPFGNSETEHNSELLALLRGAITDMEAEYPEIEAHVAGGPAIAVENADRIKKDSILAISLSVVLIVLLVLYTIGSVRNILLLFLSIGWGWLFALGGMSLLNDSVSIIVIGISSVILGIAVNYPLHLIVHRSLAPDMKVTLKEVMQPLVIGNITTVGAFLTLVPLQSAALRDLGLFASLLLVGTIIFVLLYLPHFVKGTRIPAGRTKIFSRVAGFSPEKSKVFVACAVVITVILFLFSNKTGFDSNLANINYMSDGQRKDMQYFQNLLSGNTSHTARSVYVFSSGKDYDEALARNASIVPVIDSLVASGQVVNYSGVSAFLVSKEEQQHRLDMWRKFVDRYRTELTGGLSESASRAGFSRQAFPGFCSLTAQDFTPQDMEYFEPLTSSVFSRNLTQTGGTSYVVNVLNVEPGLVENVRSNFEDSFDVTGMNSVFTENLSENFNYIGWACSLIVFFFLWFSFGRLELAVISFLPMAVSWTWILGIMAIAGIKFNIVNVILATFIFGQGDDYTIFMTEGCQHEYTYRRPILGSYKVSILQSALIMFVGIGTLIVSKHPALHSLAEVTIIGMFSVVLMSYLIPPLMFRWLTMKNGTRRRHPLTLRILLAGSRNLSAAEQVRGRYIYKPKEILRTVTRNLRGFEIPAIEAVPEGTYRFNDPGYGEQALLIALSRPDIKVVACITDEDRRRVAEISAEDFVNNIEFTYRL